MSAITMPATGRTLPARVTPFEGLRQTASLAWRTLVQIKHNPFELMDFSVQPIMFVLLFTYVFGGAVAGSPHEYLMFALPGIIVQNALFTTLNTGVGLATDLEKGFFDRLKSLPIARFAPLAGRIGADLVKQAWSVALLLGVGVILGFRIGHNGFVGLVGSFALLLAVSLAVSWAMVLVSMLVASPEKVQIFGFVVLFPLTFASAAFVPTGSMPGWMQAWVKINPVTVLSNALRGLLESGPVAAPAFYSLLWALGFTVVFAPLAVRAFKRRS
ncbi:MAG TPA: ABC transporter permease [Micromonosporaceae bacterium]